MDTDPGPADRMGERSLNIAFAEPKNTELAASGQTLQPTKVYVGGLPEGTTEAKLQAFFGEYGEVNLQNINCASPLKWHALLLAVRPFESCYAPLLSGASAQSTGA